MKRRLKITPEVWVEFLKHETPVTLRVVKNALPSDARCVGCEMDHFGYTLGLWIESEAFRPDDPIDLESPQMRLISPE